MDGRTEDASSRGGKAAQAGAGADGMSASCAPAATADQGETGPRRMAAFLLDNIANLSTQLKIASTAAERTRLDKLLRHNRTMLAWCKLRAGY